MQNEQKILLEHLAKDDDTAYTLLYKQFYVPMVLFASKYISNEEASKDIVQEFFISMLGQKKEFENITALKVYLYSSVKNSCLNYYKHLQVEDSNRTKLTEALIYLGTLEYEDNSALFEKVQECLQKLPDQQQKVLELKIFRNMSYKEIARELDISETSVHTHVKRAYKFIRESLPLLYAFMILKGTI